MSSIDSTDAWTWMDLSALARTRRDQPSYHLFSEPHQRGEIYNFLKGQGLGPLKIQGNLLVIGLAGSVTITVGNDTRALTAMCEMIINPGTQFVILADSEATVQLVWSPSYASALPDSNPRSKAGAV